MGIGLQNVTYRVPTWNWVMRDAVQVAPSREGTWRWKSGRRKASPSSIQNPEDAQTRAAAKRRRPGKKSVPPACYIQVDRSVPHRGTAHPNLNCSSEPDPSSPSSRPPPAGAAGHPSRLVKGACRVRVRNGDDEFVNTGGAGWKRHAPALRALDSSLKTTKSAVTAPVPRWTGGWPKR